MNKQTNYASLYYSDFSTDAEAIENNVQDYPVSSVARFLRLCHLKRNNDPRFEEVAKQTGIYLHNPSWMEFLLSELNSEAENNADIKANLTAAEVENIDIKSLDETKESIDNDILVNEYHEQFSDEISTENASDIIEPESEHEDMSVLVNEQIIENFTSETEVAESVVEEVVAESEVENESENPVEVDEHKAENEDLAQTVNEQISENLNLENEVSEQQEEEISKEEIVEPVTQMTELPSEVSNESEPAFNKEESVFDIKIPGTEEKVSGEEGTDSETNTEEEDDLTIPFEPLHTVDYFASQGIKLSEEALNDDQLGKQVKSFTAWLKSMKKLHPGQLPEQNEVIEKLIQTSSEISNKSANVLTEAMAEVLVKQGKREKAIEMYEKLSLINPSKSAYFAAKIESLKII